MKPVQDAPGLKWKKRRGGCEARWQARTDLVKRGYDLKSQRLLFLPNGEELTPVQIDFIQTECRQLQARMLVWGRGGIPFDGKFTGSLQSLMDAYQTDKDSPYQKVRYASRIYYDTLCRLVARTPLTDENGVTRPAGTFELHELKGRSFLRLHEGWFGDGSHVTKAHAMIGMLRILFGYGITILEDEHCERLSGVLSKMRFKMGKPRNERLTAEQALGVIKAAHELQKPSLALAQAIQFECMLRQKDVIGEWLPVSEPGISDTHDGSRKWLAGIRWEEIDQTFSLTHITSKRQKEITVDLKLAPMVMEELCRRAKVSLGELKRDMFPASGAVIVSEETGLPYRGLAFRNTWRIAANMAGIPKTVRNMDSRAGAISEATDAGAELEHVRIAATHSDIGMTQRYSRGGEEKTANVMRQRVAFRTVNKTGE